MALCAICNILWIFFERKLPVFFRSEPGNETARNYMWRPAMAWQQNVYSMPRNAPTFMIGASVKQIHRQVPNAQQVYKKVQHGD